MKSPNWQVEELKLAIELYLSKDLEWLSRMSDSTPEVRQLSQLLNGLDFYENQKPDKFRSPGSIRMKLSNFKALDERYGKASLSNVGNLDKDIWNSFHLSREVLVSQCRDIVDQHFKGNMTDEIKEYLLRFKDIKTMDFAIFANDTYLAAKEYRKQASLIDDLEYSHRIMNTCYEIMKSLEWCKNDKSIQIECEMPDNKIEYIEHGGINQVPISSSEMKIGKLVQRKMQGLIDRQLISATMLVDLQSREWTRSVLHVGHPLVKKVNTEEKLDYQVKDENGYVRYWKTIYEINGDTYCICKEWYEENRKYFLKWLDEVDEVYSIDMSEEQLVVLLEFLQNTDKRSVSITKEEVCSGMKKIEIVDEVLGRLTDMGLFAEYQGSKREFVVDDYDLLFTMLQNPKQFVL